MGGSNESCHSLKKYQATFKQHYFRTSKIIFRCFRCGWKNLVLTLQFGFAGVFFYGLLFLKECAFQILFSYELFTAEKIPSDIQLKHPSNESRRILKNLVYFLSSTLSQLFISLNFSVIAPERHFCLVFNPVLHQSHFFLSL